ncbi:DUF1566 domain-containing protein [Spirochaeta africana]|nr:DUF1566 domain-containing protein [Spirochaeta africana]
MAEVVLLEHNGASLQQHHLPLTYDPVLQEFHATLLLEDVPAGNSHILAVEIQDEEGAPLQEAQAQVSVVSGETTSVTLILFPHTDLVQPGDLAEDMEETVPPGGYWILAYSLAAGQDYALEAEAGEDIELRIQLPDGSFLPAGEITWEQQETGTVYLYIFNRGDDDIPVLLELTASGAVEYTIGDTGPAGGVVFYDQGEVVNGWRYLEATPAGWSGGEDPVAAWGDDSLIGTETNFGFGKLNTLTIISRLQDWEDGQYAARLSGDYAVGEYDDWFLPSLEELFELRAQQDIVGGFPIEGNEDIYWSSSEFFDDPDDPPEEHSWVLGFIAGESSEWLKEFDDTRVRPVRAFRSELPTYAVVYHPNEGQGDPPVDPYHYEPGEPVTLPDAGELYREGYEFAGWNSEPDGTGDQYIAIGNITMPQGNLILYAEWAEIEPVYTIGDTGPAGGIIFYVDDTDQYDGWTYLEAAPAGWDDPGEPDPEDPLRQWDDDTFSYSAVTTETAIGTGKENTAAIVTALGGDGKTGMAAQLAAELEITNGETDYSDWFLPSRDELNELYMQEAIIDGLYVSAGWYYWSSSTADESWAWSQDFFNGDQSVTNGKNISTYIRVRPIRRF